MCSIQRPPFKCAKPENIFRLLGRFFFFFFKSLTSLSGYFFFFFLSKVFVCDRLDVNDGDMNHVTLIFALNLETFPVEFRTDH